MNILQMIADHEPGLEAQIWEMARQFYEQSASNARIRRLKQMCKSLAKRTLKGTQNMVNVLGDRDGEDGEDDWMIFFNAHLDDESYVYIQAWEQDQYFLSSSDHMKTLISLHHPVFEEITSIYNAPQLLLEPDTPSENITLVSVAVDSEMNESSAYTSGEDDLHASG